MKYFTLVPPFGMAFRFWGHDRNIQFCFPPDKVEEAIKTLESYAEQAKMMAQAWRAAEAARPEPKPEPVIKPSVRKAFPPLAASPAKSPPPAQLAMMQPPGPSRVAPDPEWEPPAEPNAGITEEKKEDDGTSNG